MSLPDLRSVSELCGSGRAVGPNGSHPSTLDRFLRGDAHEPRARPNTDTHRGSIGLNDAQTGMPPHKERRNVRSKIR